MDELIDVRSEQESTEYGTSREDLLSNLVEANLREEALDSKEGGRNTLNRAELKG